MLHRFSLVLIAATLSWAGCSSPQQAQQIAEQNLKNIQPGVEQINTYLAQLNDIADTAERAQQQAGQCAQVASELDQYFETHGDELADNAEILNGAENPQELNNLVNGQGGNAPRDESLNRFMDVVNTDCAGNLEVAEQQRRLRSMLGQGAQDPQNAQMAPASMEHVYQKRLDGFCTRFQTRVGEAMGNPNVPNCSAVKTTMHEMLPEAMSLDLRNQPDDQIRACDAAIADVFHSGCQSFPEINDAVAKIVGPR